MTIRLILMFGIVWSLAWLAIDIVIGEYAFAVFQSLFSAFFIVWWKHEVNKKKMNHAD